MAEQKLTTLTNELIESYGKTAKNVINAYRVGNERIMLFVDQSFVAALDMAGPRLSDKARTDAVAAEKKLTAYFAKSVEKTSENANLVIDKAVELVEKSLEQVAANAERFEQSTGVTALSALASAAVPAAQAATKAAAKLESQSSVLADKIAGKKPKAKTAAAKRSVAKKVVRARPATATTTVEQQAQ